MYPEKENFNRVLRREAPSHVPWKGCSRGGAYAGAWPTHSRPSPDVRTWKDEWGVGWTDAEGEVFPTDPTVGSFEDIDQVPTPDPHKPERMRPVEEARQACDREEFFFSVNHPYFLYENAINILGPEEFCVSLLASPAHAHRLLDKLLEFELGVASEYVRFSPDHVNLSDDYGHQDRLAISPECWREFFKPRLKTMVDFYQSHLGPEITVSLHSCGHVMPILEDLMEIGIDVLHPVQSTANDLAELRRVTSGRLTLAGGIDGQRILPMGTVEDVRREVFAKLDLLWEDGGYLPMPEKSHGCPQENLDAVPDAIRQWSRANVE
jgi:uroporphyrinogen decarboxylase